MKSFKARKAYLVFMLILTVFINSSLVYGGSDEHIRDHKTPDALEVATVSAGFSGGQGIYTVVNGDIGAIAASPLVTGFHDKGAVYTEPTATIGTVNGTVHTAHPQCQDSCSL